MSPFEDERKMYIFCEILLKNAEYILNYRNHLVQILQIHEYKVKTVTIHSRYINIIQIYYKENVASNFRM